MYVGQVETMFGTGRQKNTQKYESLGECLQSYQCGYIVSSGNTTLQLLMHRVSYSDIVMLPMGTQNLAKCTGKKES